jgi:succinate dehydrogenase / fumarate reductase iron-sulfur subunit
VDSDGPRVSTSRTFRVFRYKRDGAAPRYEDFDVPVGSGTTVLEGLRWIRVHRDPGLAIRHSCFHASCGTCGVRVNGREALGCVTAVGDLPAGAVTVEPIANVPVLADLVVDMVEFIARFPQEHPYVRESGFLEHATPPEGLAGYTRFEDCIECGLCLSACPVIATNDAYVGPAALAYAQRLLDEPRGADTQRTLEWADDEDGVWRCHAAFECTEACPSNVRPAQRIMSLRRDLTLREIEGPGVREAG